MAGFWLGPKAAARGYRVIGFDTVGSTNIEASRAAERGDAGDVWFCALDQTAGRGRRGRAWSSIHGNLAASVLVVPGSEPALTATLGFVAGVALVNALNRVVSRVTATGGERRVALKWPNDVVADGGKLCGLLLEAVKRPGGDMAVVVGIGVNVVAAPEGLPYAAASLKGLGVDVRAEDVFAELSEAWVDAYEVWQGGRGVADILALWREAAAGIGTEVAIQREGDVVRGVFETIDDAGRLIVRTAEGARVPITAGDVHFGTTASLKVSA